MCRNKKEELLGFIEEKKQLAWELSDQIWKLAELKFQEHQSVKLQLQLFEREGFSICEKVGSLDTAFTASFGSGKPVIAILGEYDALPGMSQKANCHTMEELETDGTGHGCGHNLLGAAGVLAALAVKKYMEQNQLSGTVVYYGCPGEESGAGKEIMVREGAFVGVDAALTWHPFDRNALITNGSLANVRAVYTFKGVSAHAAAAPHLGRSALDAAELMNVGVNFLREHVIQEARIHYAFLNAGGTAANVVQKEAAVEYAVRAPKRADMREIAMRVDRIAEGAALMTDTTFEKQIICTYADYLQNQVLASLLEDNLQKVLPVEYTEQELAYAAKFVETWQAHSGKEAKEVVASGFHEPMAMIGSTDVGDVSWAVPTAQFYAATCSRHTQVHTWQMTAQGTSDIAHKGLLTAAKVLAMTASDLLERQSLVQAAQEEWQKKSVEE